MIIVLIDGKDSVQFLVSVKELLEDPARFYLRFNCHPMYTAACPALRSGLCLDFNLKGIIMNLHEYQAKQLFANMVYPFLEVNVAIQC